MGVCQIYQVAEHGELRWKWRYVAPDGAQAQSPENYAFHYQCAAAARKSGYRPQMEWLPVATGASAS